MAIPGNDGNNICDLCWYDNGLLPDFTPTTIPFSLKAIANILPSAMAVT
ncbi:MAG: hypothetical protein M2R45_04164 [Verrucomicrobia subdivision 3 bacterium]|nr:hypothetical protein [Limisphaerales bacterium]MCS1413031.1 hypothetical protein [Limisphaerales bacterium]